MRSSAHWRPDERLIDWVEETVSSPKIMGPLREELLSMGIVTALEAEVSFVDSNPLASRGPMTLRAHEEYDGQMIITLWIGNTVIRRAHLGANHREPDAGPIIYGPHIHFPTSAFANIGSRGSRSRAREWDIDPSSLTLRDVIQLFAAHVNIQESSERHREIMEGSNETL